MLTVAQLMGILVQAPPEVVVRIGFEGVCHDIGKVVLDPNMNLKIVELRDWEDSLDSYPGDKGTTVLWCGRSTGDDD